MLKSLSRYKFERVYRKDLNYFSINVENILMGFLKCSPLTGEYHFFMLLLHYRRGKSLKSFGCMYKMWGSALQLVNFSSLLHTLLFI